MVWDMDGLANTVEGVIRQTKNDYIKGASWMLRIYGEIIPEKEALKNQEKYKRLTYGIGRSIVKWYTDARLFTEKDPYCIFSMCSTDEIFDSWNRVALINNLKEDFRSGKKDVKEKVRQKLIALGETKELNMLEVEYGRKDNQESQV